MGRLGIGMAVCRHDRTYRDYTSNPIPTSLSSMLSFCRLYIHYEITGNMENGCRDGVSCVVFVCAVLPSLYIFGK